MQQRMMHSVFMEPPYHSPAPTASVAASLDSAREYGPSVDPAGRQG